MPELKAIVLMNGSDPDDRVHGWNEMPELAEKVSEKALEERIKAQKPDDCCTLIYTFGTTGSPKGVMITHDNITWTAQQVVNLVKGNHEDQVISYLPLSHIAEQEGKSRPLFYGLANKLVFSKVREKLGFDRCRLFISTAAPISMDTLEFFLSLRTSFDGSLRDERMHRSWDPVPAGAGF